MLTAPGASSESEGPSRLLMPRARGCLRGGMHVLDALLSACAHEILLVV